MKEIKDTPIQFIPHTGALEGKEVQYSKRTIGDLKDVFQNEQKRAEMDPNTLVYEVQLYFPVDAGTEGGLFFGNTTIQPGQVGNEYFMTKGHFHQIRNRGEYYWCINGEGMLILMTEDRQCRAEKMKPGSLHYISGHTAHRVANTGNTPLRFGACWPADAGHDYDTIREHGFSARLMNQGGIPTLVP